MLLAARQNSLWTGTRLAQWLGTRSYSIYLWHWPLVVALAYLEHSGNPVWIRAALLLSLLLGHLSYRWVEGPPRHYLAAIGAGRGAVVICLGLALLAVAAQQVRLSGFPARLPEQIASIEAERDNFNPRQDECLHANAECIFGEKPVRAIMVGDSHADATVTALQASLPGGKGGVYFKGESACALAFGMKQSGAGKRSCESLNRQLQEKLVDRYPGVPIVVVGRTSGHVNGGRPSEPDEPGPAFYFSAPSDTFNDEFFEEFRAHYLDTLCQLGRRHPLYIVQPLPEMEVPVPTAMGRAMLLGESRQVFLPRVRYREQHAWVRALQDEAAQRCGAHLLDPLPFMCDGQRCPGSVDGRPLYRDKGHLTEYGDRLLVPMFKRVFEQGE